MPGSISQNQFCFFYSSPVNQNQVIWAILRFTISTNIQDHHLPCIMRQSQLRRFHHFPGPSTNQVSRASITLPSLPSSRTLPTKYYEPASALSSQQSSETSPAWYCEPDEVHCFYCLSGPRIPGTMSRPQLHLHPPEPYTSCTKSKLSSTISTLL